MEGTCLNSFESFGLAAVDKQVQTFSKTEQCLKITKKSHHEGIKTKCHF